MSDQDSVLSFDATSDISREEYQQRLTESLQQLESLPESSSMQERARLNLDIAEAKTGLGETAEAWKLARASFDEFVSNENWQDAVEACDVLYQTEQEDAVIALANGVWLAITYPVKAQTTVAVLNHMVDEMPTDSDGRAVAAAVAHYISGVRSTDEEFESLGFFTKNILASVAESHSQIESQQHLDFWMERLELKEPAKFLPRMATILDVIVDKNWWVDRDSLRAKLPVN